MAICTICGKKYSKFTTPVSAKRVCSECFFAQLEAEANAGDLQPAEERPLGRESQPLPPPQPAEPGQSATAMKGAFPLFRVAGNTGVSAFYLVHSRRARCHSIC